MIALVGIGHHPVDAGTNVAGGAVAATVPGQPPPARRPGRARPAARPVGPAWLVTGVEALVVGYVAHRGWTTSGASLVLAAVPVGMLVGDVRSDAGWRRGVASR